jgi:hypothetical protein
MQDYPWFRNNISIEVKRDGTTCGLMTSVASHGTPTRIVFWQPHVTNTKCLCNRSKVYVGGVVDADHFQVRYVGGI